MKRKIYLKMHSLEEAQHLFWSEFNNYRTDEEKMNTGAMPDYAPCSYYL